MLFPSEFKQTSACRKRIKYNSDDDKDEMMMMMMIIIIIIINWQK
jgi:predicted nucleic acid-binding Zn ribbon protein